MPAPCSLLLEVFAPVTIYDPIVETIDWEASTDPAHEHPYLLAPRNYAEQEIDTVRCTATIGTVEIGVIDYPQVPGDQSTGWMTARVHDLLGRRCRLRRWIDEDVGWVVIADGIAGPPRMDTTYAAYRWSIRDTRETERKLAAFGVGGVCGVVPRGPIYGFGEYSDDTGDHLLLQPLLVAPITGTYMLGAVGTDTLGLVNLASHYHTGTRIERIYYGGRPDDLRMLMDDDAVAAIQISQLGTNLWGARYADVLWRVAGDTEWNIARPVSTDAERQPFVGTVGVTTVDGQEMQSADYVTLFVDREIPPGFPTADGIPMEIIVRYRGPASDAFPYYVEGDLGSVLISLYTGEYSLPVYRDITGIVYDPAGLDNATLTAPILYNPDGFADLVEHVMLRQTSPVPDVRAFAETNLYAPSGWVPVLDTEMRISPVSRTVPDAIDTSMILEDSVTAPSPNWTSGERTISQILYTYPRYFIPTPGLPVEVAAADGLAQRDITLSFEDVESDLRYGPQIEEYDASAFGAVGDGDGVNLPGQLETASILCQTAKFDVLDRYRAGVQSIQVSVRRSQIPAAKVGDWVPWDLMYLPDRTTGLRGSKADIAQIVSIRDDDCVWRTLTVEESILSAGPPGYFSFIEKIDDQPSAGGASLIVISDVESY